MLSSEEISRYSRHILMPEIGLAGQEKLRQAKVLVIGAGGLGCPVLLYLTAAGVGELGIVDFDKVDETNLQRQVLFTTDDIGKPKTEAAKKFLAKQNPFLKINAIKSRIDKTNAFEIINDYQIMVDCTDNFTTRYLVNDACKILNRPLVYGAIHRFEGQVSVFNYTDAKGKTGSDYRNLFPVPPSPEQAPNCSETGVLGVLPGIIGTLQANEVIKIITGNGEILSGKLLLVDALGMKFITIEIPKSNGKISAPKNKKEFLKMDYEFFCGTKNSSEKIKTVTASELDELLKSGENIQIIDVRELFETPVIEDFKSTKIPLGNIVEEAERISKTKKVIVICRSGFRSREAIHQLEKNKNFTNLWNLEGGITEWMKQFQLK